MTTQDKAINSTHPLWNTVYAAWISSGSPVGNFTFTITPPVVTHTARINDNSLVLAQSTFLLDETSHGNNLSYIEVAANAILHPPV